MLVIVVGLVLVGVSGLVITINMLEQKRRYLESELELADNNEEILKHLCKLSYDDLAELKKLPSKNRVKRIDELMEDYEKTFEIIGVKVSKCKKS